MEPSLGMPCPLCGAAAPFGCWAWGRAIHRCPVCGLHFVPPAYWMTIAEEIARYKLHHNCIDDTGYVRFLMPVIECLRRHGVRGRVLDYGAGPTPVLTQLLIREGFKAQGYDPYFAGQDNNELITPVENGVVDAVVSTEVFEHFREPAREMDRIGLLVGTGGLLVVLTALVTEDVRMDTWHYANDATHIIFYTGETFRYIARRWGFQMVECDGNRLVVLRRVET